MRRDGSGGGGGGGAQGGATLGGIGAKAREEGYRVVAGLTLYKVRGEGGICYMWRFREMEAEARAGESTHFMHTRICMLIDPCIPTMPGRGGVML